MPVSWAPLGEEAVCEAPGGMLHRQCHAHARVAGSVVSVTVPGHESLLCCPVGGACHLSEQSRNPGRGT